MSLRIAGRCEKCGREFVALGDVKEGARDPFFPANKKMPPGPTDEKCGGLILPVPEEAAP